MRLTATASERLMHIIDLYKNLEDPKGEQQENAISHQLHLWSRGVTENTLR